MRYAPFTKQDHPKIFRAIASYNAGLLVQRTIRNIQYFDEKLCFTRLANANAEEVRVDLHDDVFNIEEYDLPYRGALSFIITNLAVADEIDEATVHANYATQYALTNAFRSFHAFYGGRRYVALCRDMIDLNMGKCLQPYMMEDLIGGMHVNFNKSIGKDVYGLNEATVTMIEESRLDEDALRRLISLIGNKTSADGFHHFCRCILNSSSLSPVLRRMIVDAYSPLRFNGREVTPNLTEDLFPFFAEEEICALLETLPRGMKDTVRSLFEYLGPEASPVYAEAYLRNSAKDLELLYQAPCYERLPEEWKAKVAQKRTLSPRATNLEIIRLFEASANEEDKEQILKFCDDFGRLDLKKALLGRDFIPVSFSIAELLALSKHVSYQSPVMAPRINSYLTRYVSLRAIEPALDELLLLLEGKEYESLMETVLGLECFYYPETKLILAERFHMVGRLGLKEWKYHD